MADTELDVPQLRKPDKRPTIFVTYADLPIEGSFALVNSHDSEHVHDEFEAGYAGSYPLPRILANTADIAGTDMGPDAAGVPTVRPLV
ncbi:hypothetical protein MHAE_07209 [Mycobacterium haemophilum DSM 44634]|uniref:DUF2249 domain-containing protein n=1 Tax=Mycobacterium haemophilum TaxID=29311 RepID=UPI0006D46EC2|nr:DUF2249 domain-containing protein [Mycobacterium haemophilum]ALL56241.1 hypothetical protein B586_16540 [Mycobacterium haemophilum DSM 44634]MCV7340753.1 DUF2249 domain-containing protein [Mycobacterium haemophilum DSM 44634]